MFEKLKKRMTDPQALTLPVDHKGEKTELSLTGSGLAEVAGCRGLVVYTDREIGMETAEGRLYIDGEELELKLYRDRHIAVIGRILGIRLQYGKQDQDGRRPAGGAK